MGDTFRGIMGNFNGYALEDSKFNPQSDDSDIDEFFNDASGEKVINKKALKKSRNIFKKTTESKAFGGF